MKDKLITYFFYFRLLGLCLSVFFLAGVVYYFRKLKIFARQRSKWRRKWGKDSLSDILPQSRKQWKVIEKLLTESYQSSWKLAVLQAEGIVTKTLRQLGFLGETFTQQLQELQKQGYRNLNILEGLHQVRERIVNDKNFSLSLDIAKEIVTTYQKFWKEILNSL